jgi:hypothetical protein
LSNDTLSPSLYEIFTNILPRIQFGNHLSFVRNLAP